MSRVLGIVATLVVVVGIAPSAYADSVAITAGSASFYWDGDLTSFTISSADSQFFGEYYGSLPSGFTPGASVDFSTSIPVTNAGHHPLAETYRGLDFPEAWIAGSLTITAKPIVAPPANGNGSTFATLTTSFTMTGTVTAYATPQHSGTPLFTTEVTGQGRILVTYRTVGAAGVGGASGATLIFTDPDEK
jgi:hypothetical protein